MTVLGVLMVFSSLCSLSAKHVYISEPKPWLDAQQYCRSYFTDLSPITNELEDEVFRRSVGQSGSGWIGLYRDNSSPSGWRWSGGEYSTYQDWVYGPSFSYNHCYWTSQGWYATRGYIHYNFFCLNLIVVEERKSWEEALDHCRENHTILTSLLSETEQLLAQVGIQEVHITERVWIGLRYLEDGWLWVNGDPLVYQAWPQGGDQDQQCPTQRRCGALTKEGLWESWDCQDQLNFICM